jgi:hypothetical protein
LGDVSSASTLTSGSVTGSAIAGSKWFILGGGLFSVIAAGVAVFGVPQSSAPSTPRPIVTNTFTTQPNPRTPIRSNATQSNELPRPEAVKTVPAPRSSKQAQKPQMIAVPVASVPVETPPPIETTEPNLIANTSPVPTFNTAQKKESQSSFVDRARIALGQGLYAETLSILNQYELAYQARTFAPEAMQLRMRAFLRMGNHAAAKKVAESLFHLFPSTPQGKEAHELLEK